MMTLQNLIFPEPEICTEQALYFHADGPFGYSQSRRRIEPDRHTRLRFDTYFNLLNIGKWHAACQLDGLFAEICGEGLVEIRVTHAIPERSWEILHCEIVRLAAGTPYLADLSHYPAGAARGLIYIEITALEKPVAITGGRFLTRTRPDSLPRLAVSITTFRREAQVRDTVARLERFLGGFEFAAQMHVQLVDNGASVGLEPSPATTPIVNRNLGGAGGFARGLIEAEKAGFSHCLFMDDDASFHLENIARTYALLALARDRRTAVAGAMITNTDKWRMWENGAYFDGACHPLFNGTDLRDRDAVFEMEFDSARRRPATLYGGWWFFAFAIDQVTHHPFPFFVRGDDISFSLANGFHILTLNGVVSFQDDFTEKESPQTLYLDLRSHLIHHLVFDRLERGALGTARIALRFIMRSLLRFQYETAEAQLLAWQDVMRGPRFFDDNIDMSERRARIGAMSRNETWQDPGGLDLRETRRLTRLPRMIRHYLGIWTLNGHLLPLSGLLWDRVVLGIGKRGLVFPAFGAKRVTYLNGARDKGYTVSQSKLRFFAICLRMSLTLIRFARTFRALRADWRSGYEGMTTRAYWQRTLAA